MSLQQIAEHNWLNWLGIAGSLALSIIQPLAALAALILACLQIYSWIEKRRKSRKE
jgi:uncharacterized membrane protein